MSRQTLRTIVEHDGKRALQWSQTGDLAPSWTARDCPGPQGRTLVYMSSDGFTAPLVTDAEKRQRRQQTLQRRRRCGKRRRPLGRLKAGADQRYKEFKVVAFYDHTMEHRGPAKRKAADGLLHYVSDRRGMIRYPQFLAHGWQIGSGPIESQCRVVPDRVKGPGKRWDADNAEAVMALEALDQSHLWSKLWEIGLHHRN
jgi:hypothetical protein